jgi:hypothetical protein
MIAGLVSLVVVCLSVGASPSNTLDSVKGSYEAQRQGLLVGYGKSLNTVLVTLKKAGDLNGVLAVSDEKKKFDAEKAVPVARNGVLKVVGDIQLAHQYSVVSLMKRYIVVLDGLIKDMVKQDRIEEAKAVKAEKDKIVFELADIETRMPKAVPKAVAEPVVPKSQVPEGAKEFKGHYYIAMDERLTWHEAKSKCEDMGGHLVTLSSKDENAFVKNLLTGRDIFWIGMTAEKGKFQWIDGKPSSFSDWDKGQPFSARGADFTAMANTERGWSSGAYNSEVVTGYICEWDSKDVK